MPQIDIGAVIREKAPRAARWIPRAVVTWLRRTIHEREINHILESYWSLPPRSSSVRPSANGGSPTPPKGSNASTPGAATFSSRTIPSGGWTA